MVLATCQILFRNREDCARLDFDVLHFAGAARSVRKLGVVASWRQITDLQPFIEVDTAVLIVLALVRAPVRSACRGEIKFRNCTLGQIPESRWALFCAGFGGSRYCEHGESHLECCFRRHFRTARALLRLRSGRQELHGGTDQLGQAFRIELLLELRAEIDHGLVAHVEFLSDTGVRFPLGQQRQRLQFARRQL